jgi:hydroxylysine kinase
MASWGGMDSHAVERLGAVLDQAPPPVSVAEAETLALRHFGLAAKAEPLAGERDRNFRLRDATGRDYVFKVMHPAEDAAVIDFQDQALLEIERQDTALPVPRLIRPLKSGTSALWEQDGAQPRILRLLTYLQGVPIARGQPSSLSQQRHMAKCLARLNLALGALRHPAENHDLLWNLQYAARIRGLLETVPDPAPLQFLDRFEQHALPLLPSLRAQVVHNDFNPHNLLSDGTEDGAILGIIDFGDMLRAPLIQDLATAAAYQLGTGDAALAGVAAMVAAYHAVLPLLPMEVEILADLIATRLVLTIAITSWRATRHPENAVYISRNQAAAWRGLRSLAAIPRAEAQAVLRRACGMG